MARGRPRGTRKIVVSTRLPEELVAWVRDTFQAPGEGFGRAIERLVRALRGGTVPAAKEEVEIKKVEVGEI